jgi:hypothetical protein
MEGVPDPTLGGDADFFVVEARTRSGLTRFVMLFLIDLSTRRVEIAGIAQDGWDLDGSTGSR